VADLVITLVLNRRKVAFKNMGEDPFSLERDLDWILLSSALWNDGDF
jgi:hypothetical protein